MHSSTGHTTGETPSKNTDARTVSSMLTARCRSSSTRASCYGGGRVVVRGGGSKKTQQRIITLSRLSCSMEKSWESRSVARWLRREMIASRSLIAASFLFKRKRNTGQRQCARGTFSRERTTW